MVNFYMHIYTLCNIQLLVYIQIVSLCLPVWFMYNEEFLCIVESTVCACKCVYTYVYMCVMYVYLVYIFHFVYFKAELIKLLITLINFSTKILEEALTSTWF